MLPIPSVYLVTDDDDEAVLLNWLTNDVVLLLEAAVHAETIVAASLKVIVILVPTMSRPPSTSTLSLSSFLFQSVVSFQGHHPGWSIYVLGFRFWEGKG